MTMLVAGGIAVLIKNMQVRPGMGGGPLPVLALASPWVREVALCSREISIIPTMVVLLACGIAILITNMQVLPGIWEVSLWQCWHLQVHG